MLIYMWFVDPTSELDYLRTEFYKYCIFQLQVELVGLNFVLVFMNVEWRIYLYLLQIFYFSSGKPRPKFIFCIWYLSVVSELFLFLYLVFATSYVFLLISEAKKNTVY